MGHCREHHLNTSECGAKKRFSVHRRLALPSAQPDSIEHAGAMSDPRWMGLLSRLGDHLCFSHPVAHFRSNR